MLNCCYDMNTMLTRISLSRLNASEQQELQKRMERKQMQEFVKVCRPILIFPGTAVVDTESFLIFDAMGVELD